MRVFAKEFFYNFKAVQKITSGLSPENIRGRSRMQTQPDTDENKDMIDN
jgi:hypothetical protein